MSDSRRGACPSINRPGSSKNLLPVGVEGVCVQVTTRQVERRQRRRTLIPVAPCTRRGKTLSTCGQPDDPLSRSSNREDSKVGLAIAQQRPSTCKRTRAEPSCSQRASRERLRLGYGWQRHRGTPELRSSRVDTMDRELVCVLISNIHRLACADLSLSP